MRTRITEDRLRTRIQKKDKLLKATRDENKTLRLKNRTLTRMFQVKLKLFNEEFIKAIVSVAMDDVLKQEEEAS